MSSFSNGEKSNSFSAVNTGKNSATMMNHLKAGSAYLYDDPNRSYDELNDPYTNNPLTYDTSGYLPTFTNQAKN
jgi:hypothetical protein